MAIIALPRFACIVISLILLQIEAHQHLKRAAVPITSKLRRSALRGLSKSDFNAALVKRDSYTSLHCPENTNCIEVADNEMWDSKSDVTGCNESGMTCQFKFGGGATGKCRDGSKASVLIHKSAESTDPSTITYTYPEGKQGPFQITGTFGGQNTEITSTTAPYASAYLDCLKL